jgi:hypothetical protein
MSFIYLCEWFRHSKFYYSTLTGAALVIPTDPTLASDMVLSTLSSLSPLFKEKSDYRSGALFKKVCEIVFMKEVFRKPWNGLALPKCAFMKRKRFSGRKVAGGK